MQVAFRPRIRTRLAGPPGRSQWFTELESGGTAKATNGVMDTTRTGVFAEYDYLTTYCVGFGGHLNTSHPDAPVRR